MTEKRSEKKEGIKKDEKLDSAKATPLVVNLDRLMENQREDESE